MKLGMDVGLGPGHTVLDGHPVAPPPKKGGGAQPLPDFRHTFVVACGQTAEWIKMPLSREVGLGPGDIDIMLDGDLALLKGEQPPIFGPCMR